MTFLLKGAGFVVAGAVLSGASGGAAAADAPAILQADWATRSASCPAPVTQATGAIVRVTNINDLLIDFSDGSAATYRMRAKGSVKSAVGQMDLFTKLQAGETKNAACPLELDKAAGIDRLNERLNRIRGLTDARLRPAPGAPSVALEETKRFAMNNRDVGEIHNAAPLAECKAIFAEHAGDPVLDWIGRVYAVTTSSTGAPPHSADLSVNLEPNQNYRFTLEEQWKGQVTNGGAMNWYCGENDVFTLSMGPLVSAVENHTYTKQSVPVGDATQSQLVVGGSGLGLVGAALLNYHFPQFPRLPDWTGFALSVGPVYTLGDTPGVSHLGLLLGASLHLHRSVFITPGIHIGEFADFPAGFRPGSVIPAGYGDLMPVKRTVARFGLAITYKASSFKKSGESTGTANGGASPSPDPKKPPTQAVTGSRGSAALPVGDTTTNGNRPDGL